MPLFGGPSLLFPSLHFIAHLGYHFHREAVPRSTRPLWCLCTRPCLPHRDGVPLRFWALRRAGPRHASLLRQVLLPRPFAPRFFAAQRPGIPLRPSRRSATFLHYAELRSAGPASRCSTPLRSLAYLSRFGPGARRRFGHPSRIWRRTVLSRPFPSASQSLLPLIALPFFAEGLRSSPWAGLSASCG